MSMRGGYQIIDLKNVPLYSGFLQDNGENHIHVKGIYYNLYHSNAKMILLSGLNMDNKPHRDYEIIPYEEDNEFKAILKKVWNTDKHMVYTYFLHIANDDDVYITYEELDYDRVDTEFSEDSNVAIANSTVTRKVNALDAEDLTFVKLDGSRRMKGNLDLANNAILNASLHKCYFNTTIDAKGHTIYGLPMPEGDSYAATKIYVDTVHNNDIAFFSSTSNDADASITKCMYQFSSNRLMGVLYAKSALPSFNALESFTDANTINTFKAIAKSIGKIDSFTYKCNMFINNVTEIFSLNFVVNISNSVVTVSITGSTSSSEPIADGMYTFFGELQ